MAFRYVSVEEAIELGGLRMVVVGGVPSPWGEAAKGFLHLKGVDWAAVRLVYDSEALKEWSGHPSGPVAVYEKERPRAGWADVLLLTERLVPTPSMLPKDAADRALVFGLAHELCGEGGLAWTRRIQLIHAGLAGAGGFSSSIARYLGKKYGYSAEVGAASGARVVELLGMLATRLKTQRDGGSRYYVGGALTAADVYGATVMAMFAPLPPHHCDMAAATRAAFETLDPPTRGALDPILLAHRDMMYAEHLALPLSL